MFRLTKISKTITNTRSLSNLTWIHYENGLYSIGVKKNFNRIIDNVTVSNNEFVESNNLLCYVKSDIFVTKILAPFDCRIIKFNKKIMDNINFDPECTKKSWIVKFEPIIWNHSINISLINNIENYINSYTNPQSIPVFYVSHM